jgi:hypothetical protein
MRRRGRDLILNFFEVGLLPFTFRIPELVHFFASLLLLLRLHMLLLLLWHLILLAVLLLLKLLPLQPLTSLLSFLLLLVLNLSNKIEQCFKMVQSSKFFQGGKVEIGVWAHTAVFLKLETIAIGTKLFLSIVVGVYYCHNFFRLCLVFLCLLLQMFQIHCRSYEWLCVVVRL